MWQDEQTIVNRQGERIFTRASSYGTSDSDNGF